MTNINFPFLGAYSGGQYVLVFGKDSQEKLNLLGQFGTDLDQSSRKENTRRGPADRQIAELYLGSTSDSTTILTLHEAFFLAHAFKCLSINRETSEKLSSRVCWTQFRQYYKTSNNHLDFAIEYGVYHYFRSRSWIVKNGYNYGANFLLYKEGPTIDHAQYAVIVIFESPSSTNFCKWESLLTHYRVIQSTHKELLLAFVELPGTIDESGMEDPKCIGSMKIETRTFISGTNFNDL